MSRRVSDTAKGKSDTHTHTHTERERNKMGQQGEAGNCSTISILAKFTLFSKHMHTLSLEDFCLSESNTHSPFNP